MLNRTNGHNFRLTQFLGSIVPRTSIFFLFFSELQRTFCEWNFTNIYASSTKKSETKKNALKRPTSVTSVFLSSSLFFSIFLFESFALYLLRERSVYVRDSGFLLYFFLCGEMNWWGGLWVFELIVAHAHAYSWRMACALHYADAMCKKFLRDLPTWLRELAALGAHFARLQR